MVVAFFASARSLQLGPGLVVIALTSVAANVVAISGGILVFHDPIGTGPTQIVERLLAFCFVVIGAGLMPTPPRAKRDRRTAHIRRHGADRSATPQGSGHTKPSPAAAQRTSADATVLAANLSGGVASRDAT
jgi:hypothetical protein